MDILNDIRTFFKEHEQDGYFLVDIKSLPAERVMIYADSIKGITIDECSKLHRQIIEQIPYSGEYEITVSSPGLDETFKVTEQYIKNIGKEVDVITFDGQKIRGKLTAYNSDHLTIEEQQKSEILTESFNLNNIKSTKLSLSFKNHKK